MPPLGKSKIEYLKKLLDSRRSDLHEHERSKVAEPQYSVEETWKRPEPRPESETLVEELTMAQKKRSLITLFFLFSLLFFVGAVGVAYVIFSGGGNIVSVGNVGVTIDGPVSISGGDELSFNVNVTNENSTRLELVDLILEYPQDTKEAGNIGKDLPRDRISLGSVEPNATVQKNIKAVLFGQENSVKSIKATVEYRTAGSNAIFYKDKTYDVTISSSPVSVTVDALDEVNAGKETELTVTVSSNSTKTISNLMVKVEYPFGFTFKSSLPEPTSDSATWRLGDLLPGKKRSVKIRGTIEGQDGEERTFRVTTGIAGGTEGNLINTPFLSIKRTLSIKKPFLGIDLALDGNSVGEDYVVRSGKIIRGDIGWNSNTDTPITDAVIEVKISGIYFDKSSVSVDRGYYRSIDNTLIFDKTKEDAFAVIRPQDSGDVSFSITPSRLSSLISLNAGSPFITLDISVRGQRTNEKGVPEEVISTLSRRIKIASDTGLSAQALRTSGPFRNTGPVPPQAEKETKYTVVWTLSNTTNSLSGGRVSAILPPYVKWLTQTKADSGTITFNPVGGEVVWDVGDVEASTGYIKSPLTGSFQVSLLPSISQVGTAPDIIGESSFTADDDYTHIQLKTSAQALTTRTESDPQFKNGDDTVR